MAYIRIPVRIFIPKTKKGANTFGLVFFCIWFMLSLVFFVSGIAEIIADKADNVINISSVPKGDISADDEYYIHDLNIIGSYAESRLKIGESDITAGASTQYCLIAFSDSNSDICYASLELNPHDSIYDDVVSELEEDSEGTGLPVVSGCFHCKELSELDEDIIGWYREACSDIGEIINGNPLNYHFIYDAENQEDFAEMQSKNNGELWLFGLFGMLLSGGLMFFAVLQRKKINASERQQYCQNDNTGDQWAAASIAGGNPSLNRGTCTYCGNCGAKIPEGAQFCGNCGAIIERREENGKLS